MRLNNSWPGQFINQAKDPDRCPLDAYSLQNLENPGCPPDILPAGELEDDGFSTPPTTDTGSSGGMSATTVILISVVIILLIAIGGGVSLILRKPKKKKKRTKSSNDKSKDAAKAIPEEDQYIDHQDESVSLEDDPNYKIDESGCEWWYDEGIWWYRLPEMDEWAEHEG